MDISSRALSIDSLQGLESHLFLRTEAQNHRAEVNGLIKPIPLVVKAQIAVKNNKSFASILESPPFGSDTTVSLGGSAGVIS